MEGPTASRPVTSITLALVCFVVSAVLALAACGGSGSTTSSSPSATPSGGASTGASQQHGLVWKFKTGAAVRSSPTVADGVVYVGSDDGRLYAVDVKTGQQRWAFETGGQIRCSPVVADGMVYFRSGSGDWGHLYALDVQSGRQMWMFKAGGPAASSPAVSGGVVYVGTSTGQGPNDGYLYALDSRSGRQRWKVKTGGDVYADSACPASPAVSGGVVYFGMGSLDGFDGKTGKWTWHFNPGAVFNATPAISHGMVYFRSTGFLNGIWALQTVHPYRDDATKWFFMAGWPVHSSPVVSDGMVYCISKNLNGAGGEAKWKPAPAQTVYLQALDAQSGKAKWHSEAIGAANYFCSPAVAGGLVCLGGGRDGTLYALDAQTGQAEWQFKTGGPIQSSPAIADGLVYVGSDDTSLYALK
jgi:outer membrane protein assembly factor BamB